MICDVVSYPHRYDKKTFYLKAKNSNSRNFPLNAPVINKGQEFLLVK